MCLLPYTKLNLIFRFIFSKNMNHSQLVNNIRFRQYFNRVPLTKMGWEFYDRNFLEKLDVYELTTILEKLSRVRNM